jgi:hypothetical protein
MPERDEAARAGAMSPAPVPYLRAPNLAWLADDGPHQSDEPRWAEVPDDTHADTWAERDLRRAKTG